MSIRRKIGKKLMRPLGPFYKAYVRKPRMWSYKGIDLLVPPGVFPPFLTGSTKTMLDFMSGLTLSNSTVLEIGVGSGAIVIYAAKNGAHAEGVDISDLALKSSEDNCKRNHVECNLYQSNLFDSVSDMKSYDFIFVNPPYYPKTPASIADNAWFCGEEFQYFVKCFDQLKGHMKSKVYMVLSDDCQMDKISGLAQNAGLQLEDVFNRKNFTNIHSIYQVKGLE